MTESSQRSVDDQTPSKPQGRRISDGWLIGGMVFASLLSIGAIMGWAFSDSGDKTSVKSNSPAVTKTVDIVLDEFTVKPAKLDIAPNTTLILKVTNKGKVPHDLKVNNIATPMLNPGQSAEINTGAINETTKGWCTVPGHEAAGMKMAINVSGETAGTGEQAGGGGGTGFNPKDATIDPAAVPAKGFKAYDPNLAPAPAATVHNVTFDMTDEVIEVAPGVKQTMWLFNKTMPGPTLRGKVGDTFNVKLVNSGTMGHSIDFHASQTAMTVDMRTIQPGESLTYTFVAQHAGVWMYHCGTPPVLHHIANGMYGGVVIDPPDLEPVDHEYMLVQSELYLGEPGQVTDLAKAMTGQADAVVFNGYYNQYVYDEIPVKVGDRIRIFLVDVGPNELSAFHVVGLQFDTSYKEGSYLLRKDDPLKGGSQVLDLVPGSGGFVEANIPDEGMYALVTHKFNDASRGGVGHFIATK